MTLVLKGIHDQMEVIIYAMRFVANIDFSGQDAYENDLACIELSSSMKFMKKPPLNLNRH